MSDPGAEQAMGWAAEIGLKATIAHVLGGWKLASLASEEDRAELTRVLSDAINRQEDIRVVPASSVLPPEPETGCDCDAMVLDSGACSGCGIQVVPHERAGQTDREPGQEEAGLELHERDGLTNAEPGRSQRS